VKVFCDGDVFFFFFKLFNCLLRVFIMCMSYIIYIVCIQVT
jgi:hypothetical protein